MTQRDNQLLVYLDSIQTRATVRLARDCNVSTSYLGRHAIRQLLVRAKTGTAIDVPDDLFESGIRQLVTLGRDELEQVKALADQLGITPALVGQLAYRGFLEQAAGGAVPMFVLEESPEMSSLELAKAGRLASHVRYNADSDEEANDLQAKINTIDTAIELERLTKLTETDQ